VPRFHVFHKNPEYVTLQNHNLLKSFSTLTDERSLTQRLMDQQKQFYGAVSYYYDTPLTAGKLLNIRELSCPHKQYTVQVI